MITRDKDYAKSHMHLLDLGLIALVASEYLQPSAVAVIVICPLRDQFIGFLSLRPAVLQSFSFYSKA